MPYQIIFTDELYHHGVRGQKWGVRRYQNTDGSYKSGAQGRYTDDGSPGVNKSRRTSGGNSGGRSKSSNAKNNKSKGPRKKMSTKKKVAIGLGVAGTALAAYGAYKYSKRIKDTASKHVLDTASKTANSWREQTKLKAHGDKGLIALTERQASNLEAKSRDSARKYNKSTIKSLKYLKSQGVDVRPNTPGKRIKSAASKHVLDTASNTANSWREQTKLKAHGDKGLIALTERQASNLEAKSRDSARKYNKSTIKSLKYLKSQGIGVKDVLRRKK